MTRVLVVDDSALMRRLIATVLDEAGCEVVVARNGAEAVQQLMDAQPDVVTLDINMPEMDGLTALSLMMQARPTPVVMVSSLTAQGAQATFEALALGAVDFIAKPGGTISLTVEDIAADLVHKVRAAARSRLRPRPARERTGSPTACRLRPLPEPTRRGATRTAPHPPTHGGQRTDGLVVIGVSTGGPKTLESILPALPAAFPWPVLLAQHMPANFTDAFAQRMDRMSALTVRECRDTMPLESGHVYIARGGTDMVVTERLGRLVVQPRPETPGHPWHPSVDVLVESALRHMPADRIVGVLLTGMGNDGARTMSLVKAQGGRTIAESEETAVVFGMPQELIELGGASAVLPCEAIAGRLRQWLM